MRFRKPPLWESFSKTSVFSGVFIVLVYGTEGETHRKRWKRIGVDGVQAFRLVSGEKLNALCLRSLWLEWFLYSDKMAIPGVSVFLQDNHDFWPATIRCNSRQPSKFSHRLRSREKAEHKLFSSFFYTVHITWLCYKKRLKMKIGIWRTTVYLEHPNLSNSNGKLSENSPREVWRNLKHNRYFVYLHSLRTQNMTPVKLDIPNHYSVRFVRNERTEGTPNEKTRAKEKQNGRPRRG